MTSKASVLSVEDKVKQSVAEVFHRDPGELTSETRFVKDLHAKSANIMELIAVLEDEFGVDLPYGQVVTNDTIGAAAKFIESKRAAKS